MRWSKNRPQNATEAVFCGGVKVAYRWNLVSLAIAWKEWFKVEGLVGYGHRQVLVKGCAS
jgi:hypothetical protein